jgi:hypothetical protein
MIKCCHWKFGNVMFQKYNNERYNMQVRIGLLKVIAHACYSHLHIYSVYTFPLSKLCQQKAHCLVGATNIRTLPKNKK